MPLAIETVTDMKPEEARNHANFTPTLSNTTQKNSHQHKTKKSTFL